MQNRKNKKIRAVAVNLITLSSTAILGLAITSCSPGFSTSANPVAEKLDDSLGCKNFEDSLWTAFNKSVEDNNRPPYPAEIEAALQARLKKPGRLEKISNEAHSKISDITGEIASTIAQRTDGGVGIANAVDVDDETRRGIWLERLAQLELGDRTTDEKSADVDAIQAQIKRLKTIADQEGLTGTACVTPPPAHDDTTIPSASPTPEAASNMLDTWKATQPPPVFGGLKTFATIYQSCDAGTRAPLGSDVSSVQGISVTGRHPSGTGNVRQISNLKSFLASQPYIGTSAYKRPLPSCHDVQALPSIYDYGGKPYATTANEKVLNMFKNAGTGSKELGIDCSALVFTAYATVGLKFKQSTALKASLVNGVSSSMLTEPQKNGLTCLDHAKFTKTANLKPGDIIAIKGHVVMVADVGSDPFGIGGINSVGQCTSSNISIGKFNFTIFQSSPEKGGIGVNRMKASYYLSSFSTMGRGMIQHAVNACKAKFQTTAIVSKSTSASVVRHLGTAACSDPAPVRLTQEECLNSCSARALDSI